MTSLILVAGFIFWCTLAFIGVKKSLAAGGGPAAFINGLRSLPGGLLLVTVAGYGIGIYLLSMQIQAIADRAGLIGPHFMGAVVFGVLGSISLAGLVSGKDS